MDNGVQDTNQKNVYNIGKDGKIRRDLRFENIEKIIEEKDQLNIDPLEDVQYMPNQRYNEQITRKLMIRNNQLEYK